MFFILIAIMSFYISNGQAISNGNKNSYRQLKKKAVIAKIPGIVMTSVGGVCILSSLPYFLVRTNKSSVNYDDNRKLLNDIGTVFAVTGIALEIASIPFWVKGSRIMKKAREAKITTGTTTIKAPGNYQFISKQQVNVSLCIALGN